MIYCTRCGTPCNDADLFCNRCGASLASPAGEAGATAAAAPADAHTAKRPAQSAPVSPAVDMLKRKGRSAKMLAAAVAFTAMLLLAFLSLTQSGELLSLAQSALGQTGSVWLSAWIGSVPQGAFLAAHVATLVYTALFLVGVWMLWAACAGAGAPKTNGATLIQVLVVIRLVLTCAAFLTVEGILLTGAQDTGSGMLVAAAVVAAVVCALVLLYCIAILSILSSIKKTVRDHAPHTPDLTTYLVVINILAAVGTLLTGIASGSLFTLLSGVAGALFFLLVSLLAFDYRAGMLAIESSKAE